jgi:hypothetical protein
MGAYKKYNGKTGFDAVYHTATGYRCLAKVFIPEDKNKIIEFYSKHIVGTDGRPYIEVGFDCKELFNKIDLMGRVTNELEKAGFKRAFSINNCPKDELAFCEYANPVPYTIELRINADTDGVMKVFGALSEFLSGECISFMQDQEIDIEQNMYHSIMDLMGDDLSRGPGGVESAKKRARAMADQFIYGVVN